MSVQFPTQVWDGTSKSRSVASIKRAPGTDDWNQIVAELQACQTAVLDTGTSTIALTNSWTAKGSYGAPKYRKIGDEVQMTGGATAGTLTDGTTLLTLPAGYRPTNPRTFPACAGGSDTLGSANGTRFLVGTDGTVKIYSATGLVSVDLSTIRFHVGD